MKKKKDKNPGEYNKNRNKISQEKNAMTPNQQNGHG
jgi:hypothetical protein